MTSDLTNLFSIIFLFLLDSGRLRTVPINH